MNCNDGRIRKQVLKSWMYSERKQRRAMNGDYIVIHWRGMLTGKYTIKYCSTMMSGDYTLKYWKVRVKERSAYMTK
jgi:hypothetical protein